ncbi:OX-2 membrane glycoprotein-like isoform X2 [Cavia porcellus]|uniref:OX-2 membrane glycoprotein-like isoform X2 n=1 Tax=Cavia porcellus TaxID=10141 RepID=UPI002FE0E4F3
MDFPLHFIFQLLILPICALESEPAHGIKYKKNETAILGENVTIFCNLTTPANVVQITWQKIQNSLPQNIGTYSSKYGEKILPPYIDRLQCKVMEPNSSFLTIQEVTLEDEACYKCLFNMFPHGSHGGQICLNIITVSELTELQFNPDSEGFLRLTYSAVGKPAPRISIFPSQVLINPPEECLAQNPNGTVTVTKMYTISLETVKFLGLQHLIVNMDHPLKNEDKIVPLSVKQECSSSPTVIIIVLTSLCFVLTIIIIILCVQRKKSALCKGLITMGWMSESLCPRNVSRIRTSK